MGYNHEKGGRLPSVATKYRRLVSSGGKLNRSPSRHAFSASWRVRDLTVTGDASPYTLKILLLALLVLHSLP